MPDEARMQREATRRQGRGDAYTATRHAATGTAGTETGVMNVQGASPPDRRVADEPSQKSAWINRLSYLTAGDFSPAELMRNERYLIFKEQGNGQEAGYLRILWPWRPGCP